MWLLASSYFQRENGITERHFHSKRELNISEVTFRPGVDVKTGLAGSIDEWPELLL